MTDSFESERDTLYAETQGPSTPFRFDEQVARVFPDMIKRSVPGYDMMLEMIAVIAAAYARENSNCYDLGCSLGASSYAISKGLGSRNARIIAVDNSAAMIERCIQLANSWAGPQVSFQCADIRDISFHEASLVTMNFTLQFVPQQDRLPLLQRIAANTLPGGALVLSEKILSDNDRSQAVLTDLHHAFKVSRGYSQLEVARKRNALEDVLVPEHLATHKQRLIDAGFAEVHLWFQCFNFVSMLAIK